MEEAEPSRYVAQLKAEFDSCDTTATGFLDREELTELSRKLQLDAHLPLLLDTLLGERPYGRVNFEEFKDGFVAVLSRSLDLSTSEDDSSYLDPAVPQEVKPKFVKGTKRYGRRSRPETQPGTAGDSEDSTPSRTDGADLDSSPPAIRRAKLRRSTSLESVESLKSDEEAGSSRTDQPLFQNKDQQQEDEGGVHDDHDHDVLAECDQLDLQDVLLRRLDADLDGRDAVRKVLWSSAPMLSSTPLRSADLQRAPLWNQQLVPEQGPARSLLTATVGPRVLTRLDDGSGGTSPERVAALWTEEGIRNSREILQTLDFPLEDRLSLADLTLVLDNELLLSGNAVHQAALISYKLELQHLQEAAEQARRERDKLRADLDRAAQQNLQLVREVDDRHASMETLNESRIRELELDFRERLAALRCRAERESEALLQQGERERSALQEELRLLRAKEAELQDELGAAAQEKQRLEEELSACQTKLREADSSVTRLQRDLDQLLHHKFGSLDPSGAALSHEERFCELLREYELQCRELQDRNDELSSELLQTQRSSRRSSRPAGGAVSRPQPGSDDPEMKSSSSSSGRKRQQPGDPTGEALGPEGGSGPVRPGPGLRRTQMSCPPASPAVDVPGPSIQTELALQQLTERHQQELQQLHVQLDTQVNYYERQLDMMKQNMEVERKDISQAFKLEISELEEQKLQVEQQVEQLKETVDRLQKQLQQRGGGGWSGELERRMQRERAELEQNYAREISNLVQKLSAEKEQLEAELKLRMDQEVMRVREESQAQQENKKLEAELLDRSSSPSLISEELEQRRSGEAALQEALREEQNPAWRLRSSLTEEREEATRLGQENRTYMRLVDQLSSQIVEMEEEICSLREHLRGLSSQLNDTADLVLDLRRQLNSRTAQVERLRAEAAGGTSERVGLLQRALLDSQNRLSRTQEDFEREKRRLAQQLMELESLVLDLEDGTGRTQLEEVRSENAALQERLKVLQQQVQNLEDEAEKKRRRLLEMEEEHERSREEEERLHRENSRYREEVLDLSSRNLQLSSDNGDLSNRLHGEQEAVRMLQERLATVSKEQEEERAAVRRLQEEKQRLQQEKQRLQEEKQRLQQEKQRLQEEKQQLQQETQRLQEETQRLQQEKQQLQRDGERRSLQVEQVERHVVSLQAEAQLLRAQLLAATQEKLGRAQEVTELHRKLQEALSKVEEMHADVRRLVEKKEELQQNLQETQRLRLQNQELQQQNLSQEQQNPRSRLDEAEAAQTQAQDQALRWDAGLGEAKAQQLRRLQDELTLQVQQSRAQISLKQEQLDKAALQRRADELEVQLKALRSVLQEKVQELKEQMERSNKTSGALKELHLENSQLMAALQVTELRQKQAEKKNVLLEEKVGALNELLREVVAVLLAA
ncbi:ninein-like protein isoform 2-T2 [Anableps anableps]